MHRMFMLQIVLFVLIFLLLALLFLSGQSHFLPHTSVSLENTTVVQIVLPSYY